MPAAHAVAVILETLLSVVTENEPGILEVADPGHLHRYRVAVRRTRSALSLYGEVLGAGRRKRGKKLFRKLGARTGDARDLDVLRLALPDYFRRAGFQRDEASAELERVIERAIERRYREIGHWLASSEYGQGLSAWARDLEALAAAGERQTIVKPAAAAIRRAAERADLQIEKLSRLDSDLELHRLRIRLKKLRYALEFAAPLAAGEEVALAIGRLKEVQDQFGELQDLVVHERWLAELAGEPSEAGVDGVVLGQLQSDLRERREALRAAMAADRARFRGRLKSDVEQAVVAIVRESGSLGG